jgi:hypothetical protein
MKDAVDYDGEIRKAGWWVLACSPDGNLYINGPFPSEDDAINGWINFVEGGLSEPTEQVTRH